MSLTSAPRPKRIRRRAEFWWGKRLGGLHVDLTVADESLIRELLADA